MIIPNTKGLSNLRSILGSVLKHSRDFFGLDASKSLYPLILNNPTVTGITTQACTYKSEPAVCLPNASLVTE